MISRPSRVLILTTALLFAGCIPRDSEGGVPANDPEVAPTEESPTVTVSTADLTDEWCIVDYSVMAWADYNENGERDSNEPMLPGITFRLVVDDCDYEQMTDSKGIAYLSGESGDCISIVLYPDVPEGYRLTTQERIENAEPYYNTSEPIWFGFTTLPGVPTGASPVNQITCTQYTEFAAFSSDEHGGQVTDLAVMSDGTLWAGTNGGGIARYDATENSWIFLTASDGLASNAVTTIEEAPDGTIWIGTDSGVSHFDGTIWKSYTTADGLVSGVPIGITFGLDGIVWIATSEGLSGFDPVSNEWVSYQIAGAFQNVFFWNIAAAPNGDIWLTSLAEGLVRMIPPDEFGGEPAWEFYVSDDSEGPVDQEADNISVYPMNSWAFFHIDDLSILPDNTILVSGEGLALLHPDSREVWEIALTSSELETLRKLVSAPDGTLWIGSDRQGAAHITLSDDHTLVLEITRYNQYDGLISDEIVDIEFTPDGAIWFASPEGVARCVMGGD
jgi:streptogramin lyase